MTRRLKSIIAAAAIGAAGLSNAQMAPKGPATNTTTLAPTVKFKVAAMNGGSVRWPGGSCDAKPGQSTVICTGETIAGRKLVFTANAPPGMMIENWSGACEGYKACEITPGASFDLAVAFRPLANRLLVEVPGDNKLESISGPVSDGAPVPSSNLKLFYVKPGGKVTLVMLSHAWMEYTNCDETSGQPSGNPKLIRVEVCKLTMNGDRTVLFGYIQAKKNQLPPKIKVF